MSINTSKISSILLVLATALALLHSQTPGNPSLTPPGAPANGIFKTLDQVEPRTPINATTTPSDGSSSFTITQPGSYYLTANLTGETGNNGITIKSSNVILDLNGFHLKGVPGTRTGILISGSTSNPLQQVAIHNGTLSNWGEHGIHGAESHVTITSVQSHNNSFEGIRLTSGVVRNCVANENRWGISADNTIIDRCSTSGNGEDGIYAGTSSITECTSTSNTKAGIAGVNGASISECFVSRNTGFGIDVSAQCRVERCQVTFNKNGGIKGSSSVIKDNRIRINSNDTNTAPGILIPGINAGSEISGNHLQFNDIGIKAEGGGSIITDNRLRGHAQTFSIAIGNHVGKIESANENATAITTTSGGGLGTGGAALTTPFANIVY